jgi:hypothetical protein
MPTQEFVLNLGNSISGSGRQLDGNRNKAALEAVASVFEKLVGKKTGWVAIYQALKKPPCVSRYKSRKNYAGGKITPHIYLGKTAKLRRVL